MICKIGRVSILVLCVHNIVALEFDPIPYYIADFINIGHSIFIFNPLCHIVIACSLALILERNHIIRKIYNLR